MKRRRSHAGKCKVLPHGQCTGWDIAGPGGRRSGVGKFGAGLVKMTGFKGLGVRRYVWTMLSIGTNHQNQKARYEIVLVYSSVQAWPVLAVGLSQLAGEIGTGFGLAMGGVLFILGYITRALYRAEAMQS